MATQNKLEIDGPGDDTVTINATTELYYPQNIKIVTQLLTSKKHVVFADDFNKPIGYNIFPEGINSIEFGNGFNQMLGNPTQGEVGAIFGANSASELKLFPDSLKKLKFGTAFNNLDTSLVPGIFPAGLEELDLGGYSQDIKTGVLPTNLKTLCGMGLELNVNCNDNKIYFINLDPI